jgi:multimeric flavodoxin WrbA
VKVRSSLFNHSLVLFLHQLLQALWISMKDYFLKYGGVIQTVSVRGGEPNKMTVGSAHLMVKAHGIKRFVIAVKNEGEAEYRYLEASDVTWRTLDILQCYTLRWLVEVFFEDWKL